MGRGVRGFSHTLSPLLSYYYPGSDRENIAEIFAVWDQGCVCVCVCVILTVIPSLQRCFKATCKEAVMQGS